VPDRLLHHSTVVSIQGEDYRLKDKRRACLREYPFLPDERHPSPWATPWTAARSTMSWAGP